MHNRSTHVNTKIGKAHYFKSRDFELAEKVSRLPNSALVGAFEIAALSGVAATSIQKPAQRRSIGFPDPRIVGRMNKWSLGVVRGWLQQGIGVTTFTAPKLLQRGRGRPTLTGKFAAPSAARAAAEGTT